MSEDQRNISSFVIRFTQHIWKDQADQSHVQWRGHIRHVQGGEEISFTELSETLGFIQHHLTQLTIQAVADESEADQEKVLRESSELWEQFTVYMNKVLLDSIEQTIHQSEALKKQMAIAFNNALSSWIFPPITRQDRISSSLSVLSDQIEVLSDRFDELITVMEKKG